MLMLPATPQLVTSSLHRFRTQLSETKARVTPPHPGWYPFHSFTGLEVGLRLIEPLFEEFTANVNGKPVADIGCGDGDLALAFANWGAEVHAIDYPPTNYNQMRGLDRLSEAVGLPVIAHGINLDARFDFPGHFGFTLFLGALYHLQNPYYVLERLAWHTDWCLLSTRIAQRTTATGIQIKDEPVAYLASGMEINNDATNYWIFSRAGLLRIVQRTRWAVRGIHHAGCLTGSNPSSPDADERLFLLLQSRVAYPGLQARPGEGWYPAEGNDFCWTAKHFTLHVVFPLERNLTGFSLDLYVPEALLPAVTVTASMEGAPVASATFSTEGLATLRGALPQTALHHPDLLIDFDVMSTLDHPDRELGICVPLSGQQIPFRVF